MPTRADSIETLLGSAITHHRNGKLDEAQRLYQTILRDQPGHFDALHLMGVLEAQRGQYDKALRSIEGALRVNPRSDEAHFNLGNVFVLLQQRTEALASFDKALSLNPGHPGALLNRANVLLELGRLEDSLAAFDRSVAIIPDDPIVLNNRAAVLERLDRMSEALDCYDRAIAKAPGNADAYYRRGMLLERLGRYQDAAATYRKLIDIDPGYNYALGRLVHAKMHACDWLGLADHIAALRNQVRAGKCASDPFAYLAVSAEPSEHRLCAQAFAADRYPAMPPVRRSPNRKRERIRIAYVSGEFREQATSYLTAELFERHDRSRFDVVGVSNGWNDRSPMRRRLEQAFDTFIDGSAKTDVELAKLMAQFDIDIAVNLNGYFGNERTGVFALRPCPIQVNYLGFPGTMGVDYIDYILADRTVIPEDQHAFYAEKVVYLPDTYQVNDSKKKIAADTPKRSDVGLPESAFVFCCFNNNHKITPEMFEVWTRILRQVEGSVLWLFRGNAAATANLRMEAERRGIAPGRIIFAPHVALPDHLARHRLADLFLDTLPHNAHTTCSDALWAGLPVLTCLGSSFAGRVAASLLNAVGLLS
jgi:predicted O-linked N-acetylglucosamine transferase (SPINDLY family)